MGEVRRKPGSSVVEVLQKGDIFFFYKPKVDTDDPHDLSQVQRFYILLRPHRENEGVEEGKDSIRGDDDHSKQSNSKENSESNQPGPEEDHNENMGRMRVKKEEEGEATPMVSASSTDEDGRGKQTKVGRNAERKKRGNYARHVTGNKNGVKKEEWGTEPLAGGSFAEEESERGRKKKMKSEKEGNNGDERVMQTRRTIKKCVQGEEEEGVPVAAGSFADVEESRRARRKMKSQKEGHGDEKRVDHNKRTIKREKREEMEPVTVAAGSFAEWKCQIQEGQDAGRNVEREEEEEVELPWHVAGRSTETGKEGKLEEERISDEMTETKVKKSKEEFEEDDVAPVAAGSFEDDEMLRRRQGNVSSAQTSKDSDQVKESREREGVNLEGDEEQQKAPSEAKKQEAEEGVPVKKEDSEKRTKKKVVKKDFEEDIAPVAAGSVGDQETLKSEQGNVWRSTPSREREGAKSAGNDERWEKLSSKPQGSSFDRSGVKGQLSHRSGGGVEDSVKHEEEKSHDETKRPVAAKHEASNDSAKERGKGTVSTSCNLLVIGRKSLPNPGETKRERPYWGFVEAAGKEAEEMKEALGGSTYSTRTRGQRYQPEGRAVGEGVYALIRHHSRSTTHTHLIYALEFPKGELGPPQQAFHIKRQASYIIQIKNPEVPAPVGAGGGFRSGRKAQYPRHLQETFGSRRFIPLETPEFLEHEGCEFILIPASDNLEQELGVEMETSQCDAANPQCADLFSVLGMEQSADKVTVVKPMLKGEWA
ncbi:hypothetical protein CBR_g41808 [Chara braunii]|uniref:Uncharacterized protein n=1 Tax=Chara braunii TaxID=69332 RepID=A0A388LWW0_CHABU|nr:hypothetical protein CBR_g41808 [Chara braunii]|eukprot:GBG86743.1 hypothetical protein CBR_g41808 [Chara braunii]